MHYRVFAGILICVCTGQRAGAADSLSNWHVRWQQEGAVLRHVVYGGNKFLASGSHYSSPYSRINLFSYDGVTWQRYIPSEPVEPTIFLDGLFFSDDKASSDGFVWTNVAHRIPTRVTSGNGLHAGISGNSIFVATSAFDWQVVVSNSPVEFRAIAFGNGMFVAGGIEGDRSAILVSTDARRWIYRRFAENEDITSLNFGNGVFLVSGSFFQNSQTNLLVSSDALTWYPREGPFYEQVLAFLGDRFICAGYNPTNTVEPWIFDSFDGVTWAGRAMGLEFQIPTAIAYGNQTYVFAAQGSILQSDPLTNAPSAAPPHLGAQMHEGITITGLVGRVYQIQQTATIEQTNSWQAVTNVLLTQSPFLWVDPKPATATRRFYRAALAD